MRSSNTFQQLLRSKSTKDVISKSARSDSENRRRLYEKGYIQGVRDTVKNYSGVTLLCLKDKFDFTSEELQEVAYQINETFDSVDQGYLSLDDIISTIKDEDGIDVRFLNTGEA